MSNKTYDIIKNAALIATPILAFLASLIAIWNIPHGAELTATLTAIDTLLGTIVVVAKQIYKKKETSGNE